MQSYHDESTVLSGPALAYKEHALTGLRVNRWIVTGYKPSGYSQDQQGRSFDSIQLSVAKHVLVSAPVVVLQQRDSPVWQHRHDDDNLT